MRREADDILSMVFASGSGRRVLAAGAVGVAAARCSEAPFGIALTAGGDRQVRKGTGRTAAAHFVTVARSGTRRICRWNVPRQTLPGSAFLASV